MKLEIIVLDPKSDAITSFDISLLSHTSVIRNVQMELITFSTLSKRNCSNSSYLEDINKLT